MSRPLRKVDAFDVGSIGMVDHHLRIALRFADKTPALRKKITSAIKSAEGAKRHALGVLSRQQQQEAQP